MAISLSSNPNAPLNMGAAQAMEQAGTFNDIAALDKLRSSAQQNEKESLRQVAQQFESIFMQMVLKGMRAANAAFESELGNSNYTKFYRDMSDQQLSMNMSQQGALGLADIMVEQLNPAQSQLTPASVLRHAEASRVHVEPTLLEAKKVNTEANKSESLQHQGVPLQSAANSEAKQPVFSGPDDFIQQLIPMARQTAAALGVDPKAILAQAALETGWGQKITRHANGSSSFNLFNIKASRNWQGDKIQVSTLEFEQGLPVKKQAQFRAYQSLQQSFDDYKEFLSTASRYQESLNAGKDSASFLQGLQKAGYATDPDYANKALSVLRRVADVLAPE